MIYEELRNYLMQAAGHETVEIFDNGIQVLEQFEIPEYMNIFDQVFGIASMYSDVEAVDGFTNVLNTFMETLLTEFGIKVNDATLLSNKILICDGIYRLGLFEDKPTMLLILEIEQTPEETFAELLETVTTLKTDNILPMLETVDISVISNLKRIIIEPQRERLQLVEENKKQAKDYQDFKNKFNISLLWADKFFKIPESIGIKFEVYLNVFLIQETESLNLTSENNVKHILDLKIKQVADDFIGMACLSEETVNQLPTLSKEYVEFIFSDLNLVSGLQIAINDRMVALFRK